MSKPWQPTFVAMCSMEADVDTIRKRHADHLAYFGASEADCELVNLEPAPGWEQARGVKCHYRLNVNSYKGWRVYMLHTGCYAWKPGYEDEL